MANIPPDDWKESKYLLYMIFFEENPEREQIIRKEIYKFLEEKQKNVCKMDKRDND